MNKGRLITYKQRLTVQTNPTTSGEEVIDAFLRGDGQFREEELERKIFHRGFPGEGVDRDLCLLGKVNYINTLQGIVLKGKIAETTPVSEIMTENVLCIDPSHSIEECMALMSAKKIRHLPVIEDEQLVGIISIGDVVNAIISEKQFVITQLENYIKGY